MMEGYLYDGPQIKQLYTMQGGLYLSNVTISISVQIFIKHCTADRVKTVDHFGGTAKFYNSQEESTTHILPCTLLVQNC